MIETLDTLPKTSVFRRFFDIADKIIELESGASMEYPDLVSANWTADPAIFDPLLSLDIRFDPKDSADRRAPLEVTFTDETKGLSIGLNRIVVCDLDNDDHARDVLTAFNSYFRHPHRRCLALSGHPFKQVHF